MDSTQKKSPIYYQPKTKRFSRKCTEKNDRSIDSCRQSRQSIPDNHYLKTPIGNHMKFTDYFHEGDFFTQLASRIKSHSTNNEENKPLMGSRVSKDNYVAKLQNLQAERQIEEQELEMAKIESTNLRKSLTEEKQKRRKGQLESRQLNKELFQLKKDFQKNQIQRKRVQKEKEYLIKQIEFLQKINFDEKTRTLQSYRERYLESQLEKMREDAKKSKAVRERRLEQDITVLKEQKYTLESHFKAVKISNECLLKQLAHSSEDCKDIVLNSEEYIKLRQKYKRFLDDYKNLRSEYWSLKNQIGSGKHQSSLLSMTFSAMD